MGKWSSEIFPSRRMPLDLLPDQATSASLPLDPGAGRFPVPLLGTVREEEPHAFPVSSREQCWPYPSRS